MGTIRLQKFLSEAGVCSRRQGEQFILAGRVKVNGQVVSVLGAKVDPDKDRVAVDGAPVSVEQKAVYIALHKPAGVVTSCRHRGEAVVVDLVDIPERIYPIGRLDKESTGLLLLTNDGRLHHRLSHPSFDHEKVYEVGVDRVITEGALKRLAKGMPLGETRTRPAVVKRLSGRRFRIVLQEGRNRQIRRMLRKLGYQVVTLKRTRMANVQLGDLAPGQWRHLTSGEKKRLLRGLGGGEGLGR
jgi:23S rRNA pseudouridine2605 synthase/23S rRNA pseudouridine2604 synthase